MYSSSTLFLTIAVIGVLTLFLRAIFLYVLPSIVQHPLIRRGMDAVPASMLVALVIPFTIFVNQELSLLRTEVLAMIIAVPLIYLSKRYSYGLVIAILCYTLLGLVGL